MATRSKSKPAKPARPRPAPTGRPREYVVDDRGQPTGVILSLEEYEELVEALEQRDDIRHLEKAKKVKGRAVSWEEFKAQLRAQGKLP